jgi:hypothetical protein
MKIGERLQKHLVALGLALAMLVVSALTAPAQGVSRDEGVYFVAGEMYGQWWRDAASAPAGALQRIDRWYEVNHEHPGLAKGLFGLTHWFLHDVTRWTGNTQGFRFGAFLFAMFLTYLLSILGWDLCSRAGVRRSAALFGAIGTPLAFWLVPRHFFHAHIAVFDMPVTALWLGTVYAYWRSLRSKRSEPIVEGGGDSILGTLEATAVVRVGRVRIRWSIATGILFGLAISVKHNAWFIPPLCLIHFLFTRGGVWLVGTWRDRLRSTPVAFFAMALLGPAVFIATWPWLWRDPYGRFLAYVQFHTHHEHYSWLYLGEVMRKPPFPILYPFVVTALTVPAGLLAAMTGGLLHAALRFFRSLRERSSDWGDELLFGANAIFPIILIALPQVPHFGGVKHWLPAMPFLAVLGVRALLSAGIAILPKRPLLLAAPALALALVPALWATAHVHPYGTAAYNELAGGAPGAATLGMQRQFWGDDMVGILDALNAHAMPGARVWFQEASYDDVRAYQRDGRLRSDLGYMEGPDAAQVSVYHYHQEFRDKEFSTWNAFGTERPVDGLYLDEVPLIVVYARAGAWR